MSFIPAIRRATADDADALMGLLVEMHREAPFGSFSAEKVADAVAQVMDRGIVFLSLHHDRPVATCGLEVTQPWWSSDWQVAERWVFVHPEHRRAPHARGLLRAAKGWAAQMQLPAVFGVFTGTRVEPKVRLFSRELGDPVGAIFMVGA